MSAKQLLFGAGGVYLSYLTSSIISQKLYSVPYPTVKNPEIAHKFHYPSLIVWFSSLCCAIFGYVKGVVANEKVNPIPFKEQMWLGLLFTVNMLAANYALLYITYLEQTLGRNCRYLMVVIVGAYFSRIKSGSDLRLPPKKILVAALITAGVLMFTLYGHSHKSEDQIDQQNHWKGYVMLILSIIADALFSDSQAYAKHHYKPTANHLFTSTSFFGFVYVFIFSFLSGEGVEQLVFCVRHSNVISDILVMSVLQVLGQISIYYIILNFKQHVFPLISTTRKVLTVLLSIVIFGHHLEVLQWFAILMVFGGLAYQLNEELQGKKHKGQGKPQAKQIQDGNQRKSIKEEAKAKATESSQIKDIKEIIKEVQKEEKRTSPSKVGAQNSPDRKSKGNKKKKQ